MCLYQITHHYITFGVRVMHRHIACILSSSLLLSLLSVASAADNWVLDNTLSSITFVSIKKETIIETHRFNKFSGYIDSTGIANVVIDTNSVDTAIPIRDERLRTFLFESASFPTIKIKTNTEGVLKTLKPNTEEKRTISAFLTLHGIKKQITFDVMIKQSQQDKINITSTSPIIINAHDYKLDSGIAKLSELVGGIAIKVSVPVNFNLAFSRTSAQ